MIAPRPRRPGLRSSSKIIDPGESFNQCLNSVHPRVKFTREEKEDNKIAFLDVLVSRGADGTILTQIYRKPSNTNILIKPNSCHDPKVHMASFKGEICRATHLCTSPSQTKKEIEFAMNVYEDNGHDRKVLEKIASTYKPASGTNNQRRHQQQQQQRQQQQADSTPGNLFSVLPFHNIDIEEVEFRPYATLPFIPGISNQLKRVLNKAGCNAFFRSGQKLQNILCGKNKTRPDPLKTKGIYKFQCLCSSDAIYVGETARSFEMRSSEHQQAADKGKWTHSGLTQYHQNCDAPIDWTKPEILSQVSGKDKKKMKYDLKVQEALFIKKFNCGPNHGLNEDWGSYVKTNSWAPILDKL
jgi:hypothetical protein